MSADEIKSLFNFPVFLFVRFFCIELTKFMFLEVCASAGSKKVETTPYITIQIKVPLFSGGELLPKPPVPPLPGQHPTPGLSAMEIF